MREFLEFIRSLGYGGILGSGAIGLIYLVFVLIVGTPSTTIPLEEVLVCGALLGAGVEGVLKSYKSPEIRSIEISKGLKDNQLSCIAESVEEGYISTEQAQKLYKQVIYAYLSNPTGYHKLQTSISNYRELPRLPEDRRNETE